jgi:carboxyl-terminal processing protease
MSFYTTNGREVKDGGGIKADFRVDAPKASALEITLIRSGVMADFASEWSKKHQLTNNFDIDDSTYREFQSFVLSKQKEGDINLDALYRGPIEDLKKALKRSGYKGSSRELDQLEASILREVEKDFDKYKKDIKEDIGNSILSRYVPESMLIKRSVDGDRQVLEATKLLNNQNEFNKLLARSELQDQDSSKMMAKAQNSGAIGIQKDETEAKLGIKW